MAPYKATIAQNMAFARGEAFSFDPVAFEELIRSHGAEMVHYRAMACPVGMVHRDDTNVRVHRDHPNCSNGYLYRKQGTIKVVLLGNSAGPQFSDPGMIDGSTVTGTFNRKYEDRPGEVHVAPFDRLYFADENVLWPNWEIVEHNIGGQDRLRFPAREVGELVDNLGQEYKAGVDFDVDSRGYITWRPNGKTPGMDPDAGGTGRIFSVWYLYRPYFYVQRLQHELRFAAVGMQDRHLERLPTQATLTRENVYENAQGRDDQTQPADSREFRQPADGSLPPR